MNTATTRWTTLLVTLTAAACASGGSSPGPEPGDALYAAYSGTWAFNADESETLRDAMGGGARRQGAPGAGQPPMGRGGGGRRRGGALNPRGAPTVGSMGGPQEQIRPIQGLLRPVQRLELTVDANRLSIGEGAAGLHLVFGADPDVLEAGDLQVTRSASWHGREFRVEREVRDGPRIRDTYSLENDGRRLVVEHRIETSRGSLRFKEVYDRLQG